MELEKKKWMREMLGRIPRMWNLHGFGIPRESWILTVDAWETLRDRTRREAMCVSDAGCRPVLERGRDI